MNSQPRQQMQQMQPVPPVVSYNSSFIIIAISIIALIFLKFSLHQIPEGHVGVYWRGGRLLPGVTGPGYGIKLPLLDTYAPIQVTIQTDKVTNIPCGTKGGVIIYFEKVEVVNRLKKEFVHETILEYGVDYDKTWIYDKIHHEINQHCSRHSLQQIYIDKFDEVDEMMEEALQQDCDRYAPGVEIIAVRLTKPRIPDSLTANFEAMERERTKVNVAEEHERVVMKEVQTERKQAIMQAEKEAQTSKILMDQRLAEREAEKKQKVIENEIYLSKQKAFADAEAYRRHAEAVGYKELLTPEYLQYAFVNAITNNTKIFFGDKIPNLVPDHWAAVAPQLGGRRGH